MKKYLALLLTLVMVVALCSVGTTASAANDDYHITLKLSHVFAPTEQLTVEMEQVAARILERTNGAVEIQTYGSSQLAVYKVSTRTTCSRSSTAPTGSPAKTPPTSPTTTSTLKH